MSVLWESLCFEVGVAPTTTSRVESWKDAILFNAHCVTLLDLFLQCYNHFVFVMEREEFIRQRQPFECKDLVPLIRLLRGLFFEHCSQSGNVKTSSALSAHPHLVNSTRRFLHQCVERNDEHRFCEDSTWICEEKELELWRQDLAAETDTFALNVLDKMPYSIPFMERVGFMRTVVADEKKQWEGEAPTRVLIRRGHVVEDGYSVVNELGVRFRKPIKVNFVDQFGKAEAGWLG